MRKKVTIREPGDIFIFETNAVATYGPNVNCLVTYKILDTCTDHIMINCDRFSLGSGDKLKVTYVDKRGRDAKKQT